MPSRDAAAERAHGRLAALCYYAPGPEPAAGRGADAALHVEATTTPSSARSSTGWARRWAATYRVLVDANQHVDREGAARAGVGFYGKNTLLITRRFGSWVVLGTLVTEVEIEPTPPLDLDCGSCRLCVDACPTGALDEPGTARRDALPLVLDAVAGADPGGVPRAARGPRLRLRHLPGRLPVEPRRREAPRGGGAAGRARRVARRLARVRRPCAAAEVRPPLRSAERRPLPEAERDRRARQHGHRRAARRPPRARHDPLLAEPAAWAREQIEARAR